MLEKDEDNRIISSLALRPELREGEKNFTECEKFPCLYKWREIFRVYMQLCKHGP